MTPDPATRDPATRDPATRDPATLDPALAAALERLAAVPRLLVALDFDGVLAPIVEEPSAARPLPRAARAVRELAERPGTAVVLVSGRGLADLAAVSGMEPPVRLVGSHGGEFDDSSSVLDPAARELKDRLAAVANEIVADAPGAAVEDKPAGIAVHVRRAAPDVARRVLAAVEAGPAGWPEIDVTAGKAVVDLAVLRVSKGGAVDVLRARHGADGVFFAGDDVTDETAFARLRTGAGAVDVGVKVGDGETAAPYRVAGPEQLADVLQRLRALR